MESTLLKSLGFYIRAVQTLPLIGSLNSPVESAYLNVSLPPCSLSLSLAIYVTR